MPCIQDATNQPAEVIGGNGLGEAEDAAALAAIASALASIRSTSLRWRRGRS
jgi:hypothetical protein